MATTPPPSEGARAVGRRPGKSNTRHLLMEAARTVFAEQGYEGASLREIAAVAGVDPGMIRHHFGDKETLFITVMTERTDIPKRLASALDGPLEHLGKRATDTYLQLWEEEPTRQVLTGLVRSALTSPTGAALLSEVLTGRIAEETAAMTMDVEQTQKLLLAASHLFGVAAARYVLQVPPLVAMSHEELVEAIAPCIQRYLQDD